MAIPVSRKTFGLLGTLWRRLAGSLPDRVTRPVRAFAWISVVVQLINVLSGAAVRLTGSGLGCPTFPQCTPGSLVVTPEMGIHGLIEFGNRMVAVVLVIVTVTMFVLVIRLRAARPDLFWLAFAIGLGIPAEALIGGASVLSGLNPYVVGLHFVVSVVLITLSTVLLYRVYGAPGRYRSAVPTPVWNLARATCALVALAVLLGIVTTGAGPHAGDADAPRNGLDAGLLEHLHSYPGYAMFVLSLALGYFAWKHSAVARRYAGALIAVELLQIVVGVAQARLALPALLVGIHMILACLLVIAMTALMLSLTVPVGGAGSVGAQNGSSGSIPTAKNSTVR